MCPCDLSDDTLILLTFETADWSRAVVQITGIFGFFVNSCTVQIAYLYNSVEIASACRKSFEDFMNKIKVIIITFEGWYKLYH